MNKCLIIGGGLAGLSAANRLVDLGITPLIIEAGNYPSHKVCGEFYSPECLAQLKAWDIEPQAMINSIRFISSHNSFEMNLSESAGGISRSLCDSLLMQRALRKGAQVLTNTKVVKLIPAQKSHDFHQLHLSDGQIIFAHQLIISTGRFSLFAQQHWQGNVHIEYIGIKTHMSDLNCANQLTMYACDGAYLGHSHIEDNKTNISCLARISDVRKAGGAAQFMQRLINKEPQLKENLKNGIQLFDWITCSAPRFGKRPTPDWPRAYFIGDAAGAIVPACGDGLSMAITAGHMVGDYIVTEQWQEFKLAWDKRYTPRLRWGIGLHEIMLRPKLATSAAYVCKIFPALPRFLLNATREKADY